MAEIAKPKNPEDDWKVWLVLNPATALLPILITVLGIALVVHVSIWETVKPWAAG